MRIAAVHVHPLDIPLKTPFRIATMVAPVAPEVIVRVVTDEGLEGQGEASPFHAITGETQALDVAAAAELAPLLLGRDPRELASLARDLAAFLPGTPSLRGALDMACHDLAAQAAGMPLWRFLGGTRREIETDVTLGIQDEGAAVAAAARLAAGGVRILKVKVGLDPAADRRRLEAVAAAAPGLQLRIDANQGWDATLAVRMLQALAHLPIQFCEQPVPAWDLAGLRWVRERSPIPVMADEAVHDAHDAFRLAAAGAADFFNLKVAKAGGIGEAGRAAAVAAAAGIPCMVGCMLESRLGITAGAHLAAAHGIFRFADLDGHVEHAEDRVEGGVETRGGALLLPDSPGLGARFPAGYLASLPGGRAFLV